MTGELPHFTIPEGHSAVNWFGNAPAANQPRLQTQPATVGPEPVPAIPNFGDEEAARMAQIPLTPQNQNTQPQIPPMPAQAPNIPPRPEDNPSKRRMSKFTGFVVSLAATAALAGVGSLGAGEMEDHYREVANTYQAQTTPEGLANLKVSDTWAEVEENAWLASKAAGAGAVALGGLWTIGWSFRGIRRGYRAIVPKRESSENTNESENDEGGNN